MKIHDFFYTGANIVISRPRWLLVSVLFWILASYFQSALGDPAIPNLSNLPITPSAYPQIDPARVKLKLAVPEEAGTGSYVKPSHGLKQEPEKNKKKSGAATGPALKFKLSDVNIIGATVYSKSVLSQYYKSYLGKNISFQDLQNVTDAITARYRQDGYVISRAIVPAQEVRKGVVDIRIIEGYVSEVYTEGEISKVRARIEACGKKVKQMRPLQAKKLEHYVLSLNDIPGLTVKTVLSPSAIIVGAADLTFVVEQKRVSADVSFDNRGTRYMGPDQVVGVVVVNDFITGADSISLQTVDTPFTSELRYIQGAYSFPLGIGGWRVNLDANLTETSPGFVIKDFGVVGRSKDWGIGIEYPLVRTRTKNVWIYGQFEWLDSYTDCQGVILFQDNIRSLRFGASYDFVDSFKGSNLIGFEVSKGLTNVPLILGPSDIPTSRPLGRGDYFKISANASRYQSLGERFVLLLAANGKCSFKKPLLSAEELGFGGQQFGRAYDPSEITGDSGVVNKAELRANIYPNLRFLQQIQYYTFYDIGFLWGSGPGGDRYSGSNLGGGLRATFDRYFYGNIELSKPLTRGVATQETLSSNPNAWRLFFSAGVKI